MGCTNNAVAFLLGMHVPIIKGSVQITEGGGGGGGGGSPLPPPLCINP